MSDVKSKNLYELLGNESDQDSDKEPAPPTKVADKPIPRTGKRDASGTAPSEARGGATSDRGGRAGRRGGSGNDGAFRDRDAGSMRNRGKPTEDAVRQDRPPRGGRDQGAYENRGGRGARGGRGGRGRDDRHSRGVPNDHVKQADQSWGAPTGESELKDEQAGEEIAKAEGKEENKEDGAAQTFDADGDTRTNGAAPADGTAESAKEAEAEDNSRSYDDYLAEQAEKKLKLGSGVLEPRKANEGSKQSKEWQNAKPMSKEDENAEYFAGKGEKAKRERQRKEKTKLDVDFSIPDPANARGGSERGRGRGRGDRGDFRGRGRGRGDGFRGRGDGGFRGGRGRGGGGVNPNVSDENAFPSLT